MDELTIHTVRSRAVNGRELLYALDICQQQFVARSEVYERRTNTKLDTSFLRLRRLPSIDSFMDGTVDATLITGTHDIRQVDAFHSMTRLTHASSLNHSWTTQYVSHSDQGVRRRKIDLSIFAGVRREGYFCGVDVFRPSPASDDLLRRAAFFQTAVEEIGLTDRITVQMDGELLRMKAQEPWRLSYPSARFDGANPLGFFICGYPGVEEALSAGQRLVERFAKKRCGVSFASRLTHHGYDACYERLNQLWQAWDVTFLGSLTEVALGILNGDELPENPPSRIPAFHGYLANDGETFCGSVLIENGKRYLEIATDNAPLETLQAWVETLDDLSFEPI